MKRWTLVLFLLLVGLTLAPRTSLNPGGSDLALSGVISRTEIRPGSAVTFVVQAQNVTAATLERAEVTIEVGWDGKSDELLLAASRWCVVDAAIAGSTVTCRLGSLDPGERRTVRVTARPLVPGELTFEARAASALGPVPADQIIEVSVRGRS